MISALELFTIGIGPSSSHTVGPMRAARRFAVGLRDDGVLAAVASIRTELFGSLGLTGRGHGSHTAIVLGLQGELPDLVDPDAVPSRMAAVREEGVLHVLGEHAIPFAVREHVVFHRRRRLPFHPNGLRLAALDASGAELRARVYYSVGGGFVVDEAAAGDAVPGGAVADAPSVPYPFATTADLLAHTQRTGLAISDVVRANELALHDEAALRDGLLERWRAMEACVRRGFATDGTLPGGLKVTRRAAALQRRLQARDDAEDQLGAMDWVNAWALAVNEENAAGGRVVTAPTNGAAGIVPAVLHYYVRFVPGADLDGVARFLLTATAIGSLFKQMASISGADVGCQGEVGSACSMAAAGLAERLGGTPAQVENAAEIALEHNLGLTCDPVGGLVQVPCIERNAIAAVGAINAARIALHGDGRHVVPLDKAIKTMRDTGRDMLDKYKETSRGGLAVNVVEC